MKLSFRERLGYGLGTAGEQFPNFLIQTYLFFYFNVVVGLNAGVIATIMLVARVWDAVNDPIMGMIADRTRTRWGSYRPWAFFATFPMGVFLVLTFSDFGLDGAAKAAYFAIMYILFGMSNTASLIPLGSMANVMTDDAQERSVLGSFREFGSSIGNLLCAIAIPMIVNAFIGSGMGEARGYQMTAVVLAVLCCATLAITFLSTRERIEPPKQQGSIFKLFKVLKGNVPGICIILFFFFLTTAIILRQMFNAYYVSFVLNDAPGAGALLIAMSIAPFFILYFIPKLSARFGKKWQLVIGCCVLIAGGVLFYIAGANIPLNIAASFIVGLGQVLTFSGVWSVIPDTADYGEFVNGTHAPGVMYALANFGLKMGMSLSSTLVGVGLMASGFSETAAVQAASVAPGFRLFNSLGLILPVICALICLVPYKLTAEKSEEVRQALATRHERD